MGILEVAAEYPKPKDAATIDKSSRKQYNNLGNCRRTNERTNEQTDKRKKGRTNGRTKEETTNGRTYERRQYELHGTIQSRNPVGRNVRLQNKQPKASLNSVQDERIDGRTNELTDGRTDGLNKGRTGARTNEGTTEVRCDGANLGTDM
ncbi:hypothetical protein DPMN_029878 [Dreissena polymorpha]|uniref:Uncharacterized protein n=1 Tax=Dreissena polymorpha TaxID=45954 RepID=A0A9D4LZX8_DREPO|nr:hypothetical protein DPMN_029878 [Dreissena polymorpha]